MSVTVDLDHRPPLSFYLSVGLVAGSIIALQIGIMRVFSVGSWAHFGSLVVSLAMFGFGLTSAVMCVGKSWFERHWIGSVKGALLAFGPLMVVCNLAAQQVPFNAIFLISDPVQKWRLFANFVLYFLPFLAGALYLGVIFLKAKKTFSRVYFADLVGSGLCGLTVLLAMYAWRPDDLIMAPLLLWLAGGILWFVALGDRRGTMAIVVVAILSAAAHHFAPQVLGIPKLAVSDYKGVSYARKFPDAQRVYERASPFGYIEVYASSYLHFAPGQSDNAAFNLEKMPSNAYLGLYIDSEGPAGIIKDLPAEQTAYFKYLPMYYPYLLKKDPKTFVVQFGGGISTAVALKSGSSQVTVAEGNPALLSAFREDKFLRDFTGDILNNPKVNVIDYDGRLYVAHTKNRYDVIDLSLADFGRPVEPRRLLDRREVLLHPRGDERLHARPDAGRRPVGDLVEQGRAAEVGAEALRHDGRRGPRHRWRQGHRPEVLRRLVLSLDRHRALQARRLHAGRDRAAQRPHQGDVVRRDLLSRLQGRHRRPEADPVGLSRPVLLRRPCDRSDRAGRDGAQRQAAPRSDDRGAPGQPKPRPTARRRRRSCRRPCSAASRGTI